MCGGGIDAVLAGRMGLPMLGIGIAPSRTKVSRTRVTPIPRSVPFDHAWGPVAARTRGSSVLVET